MFYDNKIIRYINRNRGTIILVIAIMIFILILLRVFNNMAIQNKSNNNDNKNNNILNEIKKSKDTIITDTSITDNTAEDNYNLIKNFIEYCNNNDINKAYDLLTEECKENVYSSIDDFYKNYVQIVFKEKKYADIKSWIKEGKNYTYLVKFTGDIISTGNSDDKEYQDYITVNYEKNKLNINQYIGRKKIEKSQETENIKFEIGYVDIYKDYEIYSLKISNKNNYKIILDNLSSVSNTYIETNKDTKMNCSNYESGINTFQFDSGISKNIKLKFLRQYNTNIIDESLVFSSVIINATDTKEIKIEL